MRSCQPSTTSNIGFYGDGVDVVVDMEGIAVVVLLFVAASAQVVEERPFLELHDVVRGAEVIGVVPLELGSHRAREVRAAGDVVEIL